MVAESREVADEALLVPPRVALRAEKRFALIVVDTMDGETVIVKELGNFRSDKTGRACDQTDFAHALWGVDCGVSASILHPIKALLNEIWRLFANSK